MKFEELGNLLQYSEKESDLYMPNEIFEDLKNYIKNTPHIAFAYTYIYFCTWLYRNLKHYNIEPFDNKKIKRVLGYDPNNRTLNYLIKRNGLLDKMEYTSSVRDYPVNWELVEGNALEFMMASELGELTDYLPVLPKVFFLKRPTKAFYRFFEEEGEEIEIPGTFYEVENTHNIPFEVFLYCMSNKEVGCNGFYLYAYLKHKNDLYEGGYDVSLANLSYETGISERTLDKYLNALKGYRLVRFMHNQDFFAVGMLPEERKANTYMINDHDFFNDKLIPFDNIEIMKKKDYFKMMEEREKQSSKRLDFNLEELPY